MIYQKVYLPGIYASGYPSLSSPYFTSSLLFFSLHFFFLFSLLLTHAPDQTRILQTSRLYLGGVHLPLHSAHLCQSSWPIFIRTTCMTDAPFTFPVRSPTLTAPEASFKQNHSHRTYQHPGPVLPPIKIHCGLHPTVYRKKDKPQSCTKKCQK